MGDGDQEKTWLSAQAARALLLPFYDRDSRAEAALIEAAAFGAITTRCRLMRIEAEGLAQPVEGEAREINPTFWRAYQGPLGNEYEDWIKGDFTAKYRAQDGSRWQWTRARGVEFDEAATRQHFDVENRPKIARRDRPPAPAATAPSVPAPPNIYTLAEDLRGVPRLYDDWRTPVEALADLSSLGPAKAVRHIMVRLIDGKLRSIAKDIRYFDTSKKPGSGVIAPEMWLYRESGFDNPDHDFWESGLAVFTESLDNDGCRAYGVLFHPDDLLAILPPAPRPPHGKAVAQTARPVSRAPPPIEPIGSAYRGYNPRPVGTLEQIAPELAAYKVEVASAPKRMRPPGRRPNRGRAVSHEEFMVWYGALPALDQMRGYRWVWTEAKRHFRPRSGVRKKWAEELSRDRGPGRKSMA